MLNLQIFTRNHNLKGEILLIYLIVPRFHLFTKRRNSDANPHIQENNFVLLNSTPICRDISSLENTKS